MEIITSAKNEIIKLCRKLSTSKKARYDNELFMLEGQRIVSDALRTGVVPAYLIVSQSTEEKYSELICSVENDTDCRIVVVSDEIAKTLADTDSSQGIFAVCRMTKKLSLSEVISENGKYILADKVQDPGNMGTIIRTAEAVGIDGIICCGCCDIYNPKTIRSTMGGIFRMKLCVSEESEAFEYFGDNGIHTYAAVVDEDAVSLTECRFETPAVVLIGNEGNGLSPETVAQCDKKITIRMKGNAESLNAAMAAGIVMWELTK